MAKAKKSRAKGVPKAGRVLAPTASLGSKPTGPRQGGPVAPQPK